MRIDDAQSFSCVHVGGDQVLQQDCFPHAGFADDGEMPPAIFECKGHRSLVLAKVDAAEYGVPRMHAV